MPAYEGGHEATVPASPEEVFEILTAYEELPDWQGALRRCEVLRRYPDGLGEEVEYEVDVKLRRVTYRLRHDYDRPRRIGSEYIDGDFECLEGAWTLEAVPGGTRSRLDLRIDPGLPLPGHVVKMLNERVLRSSVDDLRDRVERG